MKGFLICTGKRAGQHPLYIYETRTSIYSVEELCYYIYNNIETLDEQIFNMNMAEFFVRCDRKDLADYLEKVVLAADMPVSVEDVVRSIFREINYYDRAEIEELCLRIRRLSERPVEERYKAMGDALLKVGRYAMAEKKYMKLLDMEVNDRLPAEFYGVVWYNLGVIYARMMYYQNAADCFETAYRLYPDEKVKKALFTALTFSKDKIRLDKFAEKEAVYDEWQNELELKIEAVDAKLEADSEVSEISKLRDLGEVNKYRYKVNGLIEKWKTQYREQTK